MQAGLIIFLKLWLLGCVVFMGPMTVQAAPCHSEVRQATACEACVQALDVWEQDFTFKAPLALVALSPQLSVSSGEPKVSLALVPAYYPPVPRAPPKLVLWRGEEMFTATIRLRV